MKKMMIDGDIVRWNPSIVHFKEEIKQVEENEELEIEINSYGGDAYLGIQLGNLIAGHKGKTIAVVTGLAASAATLPVFACDIVKMHSSSQVMIHNASTYAHGTASQFRKIADDLDITKESVLAAYGTRLETEKAIELMDKESFITAEKAKELGIADEIIETKTKVVQSQLFAKEVAEFNEVIVSMKDQEEEIDPIEEPEQQTNESDSVLLAEIQQNLKIEEIVSTM